MCHVLRGAKLYPVLCWGFRKKCLLSEAAAGFILRNGSRCYDGDGCKSRVKYTAAILNHLFGTTVKTDDKSRCLDVEAENTRASLELLENRGLGGLFDMNFLLFACLLGGIDCRLAATSC